MIPTPSRGPLRRPSGDAKQLEAGHEFTLAHRTPIPHDPFHYRGGFEMTKARQFFLALTVIVSGGQAHSQLVDTGYGTRDVKFYEERSGGLLAGCALSFHHLLLDTSRGNHTTVLLEGELTLRAHQSGWVSVLLVVAPVEISNKTGGPVVRGPFDPVSGYATFGAVSTAGREVLKRRCLNGGFCAFITDVPFMLAMSRYEDGFRMSYQRAVGDAYITSEIVMPTPDQPQYADIEAYGNCRIALLERVIGGRKPKP
jgi:hypothetical protein